LYNHVTKFKFSLKNVYRVIQSVTNIDILFGKSFWVKDMNISI